MIEKVKHSIEKIMPLYAIKPVVLCVLWNSVVYYGVRLLYGGRTFYDMTTTLEEMIPVLPMTVFIYYAFFPFLVVNVILIARKDKTMLYRYVVGDFLGKTICLICFLSVPTTNIRPEVIGNDWGSIVLRMLYASDAANNLFPSIHCLDSWICFIAVRNVKKLPRWYQILTCIIAVSICISTLTTKQHVIADVVSGIVLAEVCWYAGQKLIQKYQSRKEN